MKDHTNEMREQLIEFAESKQGWKVVQSQAQERDGYEEETELTVEIRVEKTVEETDSGFKHEDEQVFD